MEAAPTRSTSDLARSRLRLYARALFVGLALAFVAAVVRAWSVSGPARIGGDFPAFYGAGRMILAGDAAHLYDFDRQVTVQRDLLNLAKGDFIPFAYPPFVAVACAPLALLPYRAAWVLHSLFLLGCLAVAVRALARLLPSVRAWPLVAFLVLACFEPNVRSVLGGQNTPLSLAIVLGAAALCASDRDVLAGVVLGLLWFKPQFALPLVALHALEGRLRVVGGALSVGVVLYAVGAVVHGPAWPAWWWKEGVVPFQDLSMRLDATNSVGWLGFFEGILGVKSALARLLGWTLIAATAVLLAVAWRRAPPADRPERVALACAGLVLMSPHAVFYEAGLALPALLVAFDRERALAPVLAVIWGAAYLPESWPVPRASPLFFVCVSLLAVAMRRWLRARSRG